MDREACSIERYEREIEHFNEVFIISEGKIEVSQWQDWVRLGNFFFFFFGVKLTKWFAWGKREIFYFLFIFSGWNLFGRWESMGKWNKTFFNCFVIWIVIFFGCWEVKKIVYTYFCGFLLLKIKLFYLVITNGYFWKFIEKLLIMFKLLGTNQIKKHCNVIEV